MASVLFYNDGYEGVAVKCFEYLTLKDICRAGLVSRRMSDIACTATALLAQQYGHGVTTEAELKDVILKIEHCCESKPCVLQGDKDYLSIIFRSAVFYVGDNVGIMECNREDISRSCISKGFEETGSCCTTRFLIYSLLCKLAKTPYEKNSSLHITCILKIIDIGYTNLFKFLVRSFIVSNLRDIVSTDIGYKDFLEISLSSPSQCWAIDRAQEEALCRLAENPIYSDFILNLIKNSYKGLGLNTFLNISSNSLVRAVCFLAKNPCNITLVQDFLEKQSQLKKLTVVNEIAILRALSEHTTCRDFVEEFIRKSGITSPAVDLSAVTSFIAELRAKEASE